MDGVRHAEIVELVDDGDPDVALGNLQVKFTGEESIAQLLEPIHHVLGNTAAVVAGCLFPAVPSPTSELCQQGITRMVVCPLHRTIAGGIVALASRSLMAACVSAVL